MSKLRPKRESNFLGPLSQYVAEPEFELRWSDSGAKASYIPWKDDTETWGVGWMDRSTLPRRPEEGGSNYDGKSSSSAP